MSRSVYFDLFAFSGMWCASKYKANRMLPRITLLDTLPKNTFTFTVFTRSVESTPYSHSIHTSNIFSGLETATTLSVHFCRTNCGGLLPFAPALFHVVLHLAEHNITPPLLERQTRMTPSGVPVCEVLDRASNAYRDNKKHRISRHIQLANKELHKLMLGVTICCRAFVWVAPMYHLTGKGMSLLKKQQERITSLWNRQRHDR